MDNESNDEGAEQPAAPHIRTFSLNSEEAYNALCPNSGRPWRPEGTPPRESSPWARDEDGPWISAEDDEAAQYAARSWLWHLQNGRIGAKPR